jgi:hypothetical protein
MISNPRLMVTLLDHGDTAQITGNCVFTGEEYQCQVPAKGLERWLAGEHIQNAMPTVSADDREFIKSGISPKGWSKAFR